MVIPAIMAAMVTGGPASGSVSGSRPTLVFASQPLGKDQSRVMSREPIGPKSAHFPIVPSAVVAVGPWRIEGLSKTRCTTLVTIPRFLPILWCCEHITFIKLYLRV
jgi:hypothetical protein